MDSSWSCSIFIVVKREDVMIYPQLLGVQPQLSTSQLLIHSHPLPQRGEKSEKKVKLMDCDKKSLIIETK